MECAYQPVRHSREESSRTGTSSKKFEIRQEGKALGSGGYQYVNTRSILGTSQSKATTEAMQGKAKFGSEFECNTVHCGGDFPI